MAGDRRDGMRITLGNPYGGSRVPALEPGGVLMGNEVKILLEVHAVKTR